MEIEDFRHIEPVTVRWGDMDRMGHVNNAKYFTYCEAARISYFDAIRLDEHAAAATHGPALATATCNFLRQVHYPAKLEVGARVTKIGRRTFTHEYLLWHQGTEEVVAEGSGIIVWIDYAVGKAVELPAAVRAAIEALEGRSYG